MEQNSEVIKSKEQASDIDSSLLVEAFNHVAAHYKAASTETLKDHKLAKDIRQTIPRFIQNIINPLFPEWMAVGSPGKGNWSTVPWVAIFDPSITEAAERGFYVVYLFSADMKRLASQQGGIDLLSDSFGNEENEEQDWTLEERLYYRKHR